MPLESLNAEKFQKSIPTKGADISSSNFETESKREEVRNRVEILMSNNPQYIEELIDIRSRCSDDREAERVTRTSFFEIEEDISQERGNVLDIFSRDIDNRPFTAMQVLKSVSV